jgi:ribulose-5-phosphate 4-epimerase/fuculose-1-phosphate aldolase
MTTFERVLPMGELGVTAPAETELALRRDLAAAYRIFEYFKMNYLIFNHLTVRIPGPERHFLINPFGLRYDEVTASNLVKIDLDGKIIGTSPYNVNEAGFIIHSAVHAAREDISCVMHLHTAEASAVSAMDGEMQYLDFASAGFYQRIAYHDFGGVHADDTDRIPLVRDLGDANVMILRNHGMLTCGKTIAGAFNLMYALQEACKAQVMALSMNVPLRPVKKKVAEKHSSVVSALTENDLAFRALVRLMEKRDPSFLN